MSITGNILLYKSEPKVRRVVIEDTKGNLAKQDAPDGTNRAPTHISTPIEKGRYITSLMSRAA